MGSLPRTVLRLALTSLLVLGCASGARGPANGAAGALAAAWVWPTCLVADTSAPTTDTLFTLGVLQSATVAEAECEESRGSFGAEPVVVALEARAGVDLRDALELGLGGNGGRRPDVLVTRDPGVIAYARGRSDLLVEALPWSATYVFVAVHLERMRSDTAPPDAAVPSAAAREAMARDAVTADARGAEAPFRWRTDVGCASSRESAPPTDAPPVIAYAETDATARQLAERIVSLAASDARPDWLAAIAGGRARATTLRVSPMPADSVPVALAAGRAVAAVLAIPRDPRQRCGTLHDARVSAGAVPLVDTRAHVIVRRGSGAAFRVAADGSFHFIRRAAR